jgi:hypothetical protein
MKKRWYLGRTKGNHSEAIYLEDFSWDCGWYWGGGYIGNRNMHCHFDGCFLDIPDIRGHSLGGQFVTPWTPESQYLKKADMVVINNGCSVWEPLSFFLDEAQYSEREWWRIKDLFKQFYALRAAAECFQYGGHCTSEARNPLEINKEMQDKINAHIGNVIIPEIRKVLNKEAGFIPLPVPPDVTA